MLIYLEIGLNQKPSGEYSFRRVFFEPVAVIYFFK